MASQYDTDFYGWTQTQSTKLRALLTERSNLDIDLENIAEEIDSMGRSDYRQLVSRFEEICIHLLKLHYSTILDCERLWKNSVRGQRKRIAKLLRESPSLRPRLPEALVEGFEDALRHFTEEKLIELVMPDHLPGMSPFDVDDCLADEWWPEMRGRN
jgi:Domain of unknown function DUF29